MNQVITLQGCHSQTVASVSKLTELQREKDFSTRYGAVATRIFAMMSNLIYS